MNIFRRQKLCGAFLLVSLSSQQILASTVTYEAENAQLHQSSIQSTNPGFTGAGYADFGNIGSYVEWTVSAPVSGDYTVSFRYSSKFSRPCDLFVDDNPTPVQELVFFETGAWNIWDIESLSLYLPQGTHTLKAFASTSTGPNIDWLSLSSSAHERLESNEVLFDGEFISSPSGKYQFGLREGNLVVLSDGDVASPVWSAGISGATVCKMQGDGNLVCRNSNGNAIWDSDTDSHDGAHVLMTDAGRAIIDLNGVSLWSEGQTPQPPTTPAPFSPNPMDTVAPVMAPTPQPVNPSTSAPNGPTNADIASGTTGSSSGYPATIALEPNNFLSRGQFVSSPNGSFRIGLRGDGELILETISGSVLWSAGILATHGSGVGYRVNMQGDGNLVIRDVHGISVWDSDTYENDGAQLLVTDGGQITIELKGIALWSAGGSSPVTSAPVNPPTPSPVTPAPVPLPTPSPVTPAPVRLPTPSPVTPAPVSQPQSYPSNVVLEADQFLALGQFKYSPNGAYKVGLTNAGELVLQTASGTTLWAAGVVNTYGVGRTFRCFMQGDGNVIMRDHGLRALWNTQTSNNFGSYMVVDDGGQVAIMHGGTPIWLQGIPRGTYVQPPASQDLHFPIRGQFYYPWYPGTWSVNDAIARFEPTLGFYSSGDPNIVEEHIDMLEYAYTDLSIASWWGPDTNLDKARITLLMDKTLELSSSIKWTIYHEDEFHLDPSPVEIRADLDYLMEWFAWHPTWAHIDRRPVIFVYNEVGCDVAARWMAASNNEWYVVLKVFKDFRFCPVQPDSWHQYGPADAAVQVAGHSFGVSPGFWRADIAEPLLERVSEAEFCANVDLMVKSNDPWQLVTTFNEAGEGTMVEPSPHWPSSSGYGYYLDCLHTYH